MNKLYCFTIGHVDGETSYQICSPDKKEVKDFYNKFGHEGDTISLSIYERSNDGCLDTTRIDDFDIPDQIFKELE